MIDIYNDDCCGCRVCELVCPVKAITMNYDKEGFLYPQVNKNKCTECKQCKKYCTVNKKPEGNQINTVYAAWSKDKQELKKSASGGIAYVLAQEFVRRQGCVYGAVYGKDMKVHYERADNAEDIKKMRGSKYVQCDTDDIFLKVMDDLEADKLTLFIGTPCQISGLKKFLNKEYEKLYVIDILCQGVTSPLLFQAYCKLLSKKYKGKIINYEFRNKDKHGWSINAKIDYEQNNKIRYKYISGGLEKYILAYTQGPNLRKNCYQCSYTSVIRMGDITIGDFWGIKKWHENLDVDKGISCIAVNNKKGEVLFQMIKEKIEFLPESLEHLLKTNKPLSEPCKRPEYRNKIFDEFNIKEMNRYKAKELGRSYTIVDILTRIFLLIPPSMQRNLQKTFLYKCYKNIVK